MLDKQIHQIQQMCGREQLPRSECADADSNLEFCMLQAILKY